MDDKKPADTVPTPEHAIARGYQVMIDGLVRSYKETTDFLYNNPFSPDERIELRTILYAQFRAARDALIAHRRAAGVSEKAAAEVTDETT